MRHPDDRQGEAPPGELLLDAAAARRIDRRTIESLGIPAFTLMESAGRACVDELERWWSERGEALPPSGTDSGPGVLVLVGPGNNGGDGLVIARTLWNRGVRACVLVPTGRGALERASDEVRRNASLWDRTGASWVDEAFASARLEGLLREAPVVVDALFGTGLGRDLTGVFAALVEAVNASATPVLAVDLPSGLDADTGSVHGTAIRADRTVTFVARKQGMLRGAGPDLCGRVTCAEIGIPAAFAREAAARN